MKEDHPKINFGKTGVLLINLGTPDSTNWLDIRKYLKEFLSDRRVIEVNPYYLADNIKYIYSYIQTIKNSKSLQRNMDERFKQITIKILY